MSEGSPPPQEKLTRGERLLLAQAEARRIRNAEKEGERGRLRAARLGLPAPVASGGTRRARLRAARDDVVTVLASLARPDAQMPIGDRIRVCELGAKVTGLMREGQSAPSFTVAFRGFAPPPVDARRDTESPSRPPQVAPDQEDAPSV